MAMNAGKVTVTQNPLSVNWAQWLAFFEIEDQLSALSEALENI